MKRAESDTLAMTAAFGALWACGPFSTDRIDTSEAKIVASYRIGCYAGITAGFGSLWIAQRHAVIRLNPATGATTATIAVRGGGWGIATGAGSVWVADTTPGPGMVSRLDPTTNRVVATINTTVRTRNIVATDTAVWITTEPLWNTPDQTSLIRIDPATNTIVSRFAAGIDAIGLDLAGRYCWVVAFGGAVLVVDTQTNATVYLHQLTPDTGTLGGERLTVADNNIWITAQSPGTLIRVDPGPFAS